MVETPDGALVINFASEGVRGGAVVWDKIYEVLDEMVVLRDATEI